MSTLSESLSSIKSVEDTITSNKVANFAYTDEAYAQNVADGVSEYNVNNAQNIPTNDASTLKVNSTVLNKGYRTQASSITRMLMNHFLGRTSYNLNKVNDNMASLLETLIENLGKANGFATLDENGRVPYSQLAESAIEYKGNWNAETNDPSLSDGMTGATKGDFYIVTVAGTQNLGSGDIQFFVNDRVIYDGTLWERLSAGDVKTVNSVLPVNGNIPLTGADIPVSLEDTTLLSALITNARIADGTIKMSKFAWNSPVYAKHQRFLQYYYNANDPSDHSKMMIREGTYFRFKDGNVVNFEEDTIFATVFNETAQNGKDYKIYLDSAGTSLTLVLVSNDTLSSDNSYLCIGQCHTLCADAGDSLTASVPTEETSTGTMYLIRAYDEEKEANFFAFYNKEITSITSSSYYNIGNVAHPLAGFKAGEVLPESVWCLTFHPSCPDWSGMVYDRNTDKAIDIYLQSGTGRSTKSAYGATHTVSRQQVNHEADMQAVGKLLLSDSEFYSASLGSPQTVNIYGSADASTVGGHSSTEGVRMVSYIGAEECCGYLWQWLRDVSSNGSSGEWQTYDGAGYFGKQYGMSCGLLAGGPWSDGSTCGSRCRGSTNVRSSVNASIGGRGSAGVVRDL